MDQSDWTVFRRGLSEWNQGNNAMYSEQSDLIRTLSLSVGSPEGPGERGGGELSWRATKH